MQTFKPLLLTLNLVCAASSVHGQATFFNLDFASASIPPGTAAGSLVPVDTALPGWTVYVGDFQQGVVLYNGLYTGTATVDIQGPGSPFGGIPDSAYTAVLQAGLGFSGPSSAAIAQTGVIPDTAKSILFTATPSYAAGWQVTVAGQVIPMSQGVQVGSGFFRYVGDVSVFAGQSGELRFTALVGEGAPAGMWVSDISFSPNPAPEPGSCALIFCGAVLLGSWYRRKTR